MASVPGHIRPRDEADITTARRQAALCSMFRPRIDSCRRATYQQHQQREFPAATRRLGRGQVTGLLSPFPEFESIGTWQLLAFGLFAVVRWR